MKAFQSLSESEMEIMQVIWRSGTPMTTGTLLNLFAHKGWKIQTMSTFLTRLADKGVLSVERRGKANWYTPILSEKEYHSQEARSLVDSMYHGSVVDFLAAFYGGEKLSAEEAESLRSWFEKEAKPHD